MTKADVVPMLDQDTKLEAAAAILAQAAPSSNRAEFERSSDSDSSEEADDYSSELDGAAQPRCAVLVVDDTEEGFAPIRSALSQVDVSVICARSGKEALSMVSDEQIALVLLDVSMPEMDGFQVAREIRKRCGDAAPPVIFVTALRASNELVLGAYEAGSVDFLHKPVNPSIIRAKVETFVALHRKRKVEKSRTRNLATMQHGLVARRSAVERAARDVSFELAELQHRNRELAHRNEELNNFAHVISHDLRQPLRSILDYLELISECRECNQSPDIRRWLSASRKLGENMQELISDVLEYATIGTKSMAFRLVDGNAVLQNALENLLAVIRSENAMITYDPLPKILGSEAFLTRLLQNLIGNAIKYRRDEQPRVRITCQRQDDKRAWLIGISDNGRGIPREHISTIFDMFSRVGDSTRIGGSGVGLAICKRVVELHGGKIWAESVVGKGSEFFVQLPNFDEKFV